MKSKEKALLVAELAKAKLAEDVVILDMRKVSSITDFFVIASASSTKRCQTIADNIESGLSEKREHVYKIEGYREGLWVLVDSFDVVVHIFYGDVRKFYNLEGLWGDAPRIKLCHKKKKSRSKKTLTKK
ncbi:MAG: ribosome silencing factor [Candidatus Omnitrophica bacterium]|nr:ribosome silencing factor [Candidatus Omnitrophota bacterium]